MKYQYRTVRGSGSSPRTGVKAPLKNAIIAVVCIIALIATALVLPASRATADNPTRHPWGIFPDTPPAYCGDGSVTVLSSTGEVYLVGVGKNDVTRKPERNAGADGSAEIAAKCIIPGTFLPGTRSFRGNESEFPGHPHAESVSYQALASAKDGTMWAALNQYTGDDPKTNHRHVAVYRIRPGDSQWTQMGGTTGPSSNPRGYWGYSTSDLENLGQVIGGSVNPTNNRYYFVSTQPMTSGGSRTTTLHIWEAPEDSGTEFNTVSNLPNSGSLRADCTSTGTDRCLPTEVGTINVNASLNTKNHTFSGGDIAFSDNGDLTVVISYPGEHGNGYQEILSYTGTVPAEELNDATKKVKTLQGTVTSKSRSYTASNGYEPAAVSGLAMSHSENGSSYPVISRLASATYKNNLYDFTGYQMASDTNRYAPGTDFYSSTVFAFPVGPAYIPGSDAGGRPVSSHVIGSEPGGLWYNKYSPTGDSRFWDQEFTDLADGVRAPTGSLTINKVDKDDNNQKLSGAKFAFWQRTDKGCDVDIKNLPADAKTTDPTDTDGQVTVNNLAYGTYCVKETTAPDNHKLDDKAQTAVISATAPNVTLTFKDELVGTITVKKTDESSGDALAGASFVLYKDVNNDGKVDPGDTKYPNNDSATKKTDSNGLAEWTDISIGHYILQETKAPEGYVTPSGEQADHPVEVTKDNAKKGVTLTITNFTFTAQLPLTGGTSTDVFVISSVALIVIAGGLYGLYVVRRRRQSLR